VFPDPLFSTASTPLATYAPQNTEEDFDDPEPAGVGDIQME